MAPVIPEVFLKKKNKKTVKIISSQWKRFYVTHEDVDIEAFTIVGRKNENEL